MCLPTGDTPKPVYQRVAAAVADGAASFAKATVFLLDEFGGLEPDDPARCEASLRRDLLDHVDLPETHFHCIDPATDDSDGMVRRFGSAATASGIDLTILGLGSNGHIGLNEPGSAATSAARIVTLSDESHASVARYGSKATADWGLTLGLAEILSSRTIWLLATGAHKAEIVRTTLEGPIGDAVPASHLRTHPNATALLDGAAASLLT